jgi:hypothetical protein
VLLGTGKLYLEGNKLEAHKMAHTHTIKETVSKRKYLCGGFVVVTCSVHLFVF